jgi:hypothetical protein
MSLLRKKRYNTPDAVRDLNLKEAEALHGKKNQKELDKTQ